MNDIPRLNTTTEKWRLSEDEASDVVGVDVTLEGKFRTDRGRKPIGVSIPVDDRPITAVEPANADALVSVRFPHVVEPVNVSGVGPTFYHLDMITATGFTYDPDTGIILEVGSFTTYTFRAGQDHVVIHDPISLRGVHLVSEKIDADSIRILPGLTSAGSVVTIDNAFLVKGSQIINPASFDSETIPLVKSPQLYDEEGPWDSDLVDGVIFHNSDEREGSQNILRIVGVGTYGQENDSLLYAAFTKVAMSTDDKIEAIGASFKDRRGFFVTNGRKFWLQRNGVYDLLLDLGTAVDLGTVWRFARIASNRFMLVNEKYAPRILHLEKAPMVLSIVSEDEVLAGCVPPRHPLNQEDVRVIDRTAADKVFRPSWYMENVSSKGFLKAGSKLQVRVRGVNLVDNIYSDFVSVAAYDATDPTDEDDYIPSDGAATDLVELTVIANDGVTVFAPINDDEQDDSTKLHRSFSPAFHSRITHIEVWRTSEVSGGIFFLESRMVVADLDLGESRNTANPPRTRVLFKPLPADDGFPVRLSEDDLNVLPILTQTENEAGGLPPICRDVINLGGTTLCFGKASSKSVDPTVFSQNFWARDATYFKTSGNITLANLYTNYLFQEGDQLVVVIGGNASSGGLEEKVFDIQSGLPPNSLVLGADLSAASQVDDVFCYIRRPIVIPWPKIEDDEDVWFSRTDIFRPENFPPRVLQLSRNGDIFRRAVRIGLYAVVVMDQAVHLLHKLGTELLKDTVSDFGVGTPWKDSVVVVDKSVYWATPLGIRILSVSNEPDELGHRGRIDLRATENASWFQDALDNDEDIDGGYDSIHRTLRFRRKLSDHTYQTLQIGFDTKKSTFLDDDNGLRYVRSSVAEVIQKRTSTLYSVDPKTGAVFEVNYRGLTHPYDEKTLQDTLDKTYDLSAISIRHRTTNVFTSEMVGEIIRFNRDSVELGLRTILTADDRKITFDLLPGLTKGDEFIIGAIRLRIRGAPIRGTSSSRVKTLESLSLRSYPGKRGAVNPITLNSYENFEDEVRDTKTVEAFLDSKDGKTSDDRVSSLEAQGNALEVEIESLGARNDLDLEMLEVTVLEDLDETADQETS